MTDMLLSVSQFFEQFPMMRGVVLLAGLAAMVAYGWHRMKALDGFLATGGIKTEPKRKSHYIAKHVFYTHHPLNKKAAAK